MLLWAGLGVSPVGSLPDSNALRALVRDNVVPTQQNAEEVTPVWNEAFLQRRHPS